MTIMAFYDNGHGGTALNDEHVSVQRIPFLRQVGEWAGYGLTLACAVNRWAGGVTGPDCVTEPTPPPPPGRQ